VLTENERRKINSKLQLNGFSPLNDPASLIPQIAYFITGHDEFREMLVTCEPEERNRMYDALRPNLRFRPKPLDVYMAEAFAIMAAKQTPLLGPDGKLLIPYRVPEIGKRPEGSE
jgi:hypothetical protein